MLRFFLFSILFLLHSQNATGVEAPPVEKLKSLLSKTRSLSADFYQITLEENGITGRKSEGNFLLQRPGKFRWDYQTPYQQTIVSNGEKVWFYDVDLEQVTVKKINTAIGSTPALLLTGQVDLDQNFTLEALGQADGLTWVKLLPKSEESAFQYIMIGMDENFLGAMELSDNFGQLTRIQFSKVKTNANIDPQQFRLEHPPGVDVFEEQ